MSEAMVPERAGKFRTSLHPSSEITVESNDGPTRIFTVVVAKSGENYDNMPENLQTCHIDKSKGIPGVDEANLTERGGRAGLDHFSSQGTLRYVYTYTVYYSSTDGLRLRREVTTSLGKHSSFITFLPLLFTPQRCLLPHLRDPEKFNIAQLFTHLPPLGDKT
ncbi:hypothetical protein Bbelb_014450 [Branchiostoma belcheri]|nr:hypothetical protein Bbelb_014450 [Branchiostoma belcheri]